eukprot:1029515-Rhodomonas_salina.1
MGVMMRDGVDAALQRRARAHAHLDRNDAEKDSQRTIQRKPANEAKSARTQRTQARAYRPAGRRQRCSPRPSACTARRARGAQRRDPSLRTRAKRTRKPRA